MIVYETNENEKAGAEDIDGMEGLLGDDDLDTDWDIEVENPPHEGYDGPDLQAITG